MGRRSILLVAFLTATACGGGGGSNVSTGTGGTSSPAPVSVSLNTGEVKPSADSVFLSATMDLTISGEVSETNGIITGGMTSNRLTWLDTPQFSGSYSAATGYRLSDSANLMTFGATQLTSDTTAVNGNGIVFFANRAGNVEDYLALYQHTTYSSNVYGSGYTTSRFGGTGGWQHTVVNGSSRQTRLNYFAYGVPTQTTAMPRSGTVKYSMLNAGNFASDTDLSFLKAGSSEFLTVDFSTGKVSGKLGLAGENFFKNIVGGIGYIPIVGSLTGNSLAGNFSDASMRTYSGISGQFRLMFVGPNAEEVVITYVARDGLQATVGASVAVIDPFQQR